MCKKIANANVKDKCDYSRERGCPKPTDTVGSDVGPSVGEVVGYMVGVGVGILVGSAVGAREGVSDGVKLGRPVWIVGMGVGNWVGVVGC